MTAGALAFAFKQPAFALDKEKEADELAAKITKVMAHYGDIPGLNEKTLDWLALLYTIGIVAAPRVVIMRAQKKQPVDEQNVPSSARPEKPQTRDTVDIPGVGKVQVM